MRKTIHQLFAVLLLLVATNHVSVASSGIAVTLVDFRLNTTQNVNLGYTLTISAQVKNTDTLNSFAGVLNFGLRNNSDTLSSFGIFNTPTYTGNQIFLNPGETVPAIFSVDIDDPYFAPGPDVVVVWPICSEPVTDSILINLLIQNSNALEEKQNDDFSYIVMNDRILLRYTNNELNFKQVRIFNILGQMASQFRSDFITEIPIPNLPKGIYLCEMISADNKTRVIKFCH